MLALFRDDHYQRWELVIDEDALERLRWLSFEPPTAESFGRVGGLERVSTELEMLFHDRDRITEIAWQLVLPQAHRRGINRAAFVRGVAESFDNMRRELFASLSLFAFGDRLATIITDFHDGMRDYAYER